MTQSCLLCTNYILTFLYSSITITVINIIFCVYYQAWHMVGGSCLFVTSIPFCPFDQCWWAHFHYRHVASREWNPNQEGSSLQSCIPFNLAEVIQVCTITIICIIWLNWSSMKRIILIGSLVCFNVLNSADVANINSWNIKEFCPLLNPVFDQPW